MSTDCKPFRIIYEFNFAGGIKKAFTMDFDPETHEFIARRNSGYISDWARLEYKKCPECPLDAERIAFCPVAFNISGILNFFSPMTSTERCFVRCITYQRTYSKTTDSMSALSSALAPIIFSSPCPFLVHVRPLARFHLPFFTPEESLVRSISFYLLSQYFVSRKKKKPDWDLAGLNLLFDKLKMVQSGMMRRSKNIFEGDACINAIHSFHVMLEFVAFEIDSAVECLESSFYSSKAYRISEDSLKPFMEP